MSFYFYAGILDSLVLGAFYVNSKGCPHVHTHEHVYFVSWIIIDVSRSIQLILSGKPAVQHETS